MAASALPAAWAAGVPGSAALPTLYLQAARQQQQQRARYRDGIAPRCQVAPWLRLQVAQRQVLQPRDIADRGREGLRVVGLVQPVGRAQVLEEGVEVVFGRHVGAGLRVRRGGRGRAAGGAAGGRARPGSRASRYGAARRTAPGPAPGRPRHWSVRCPAWLRRAARRAPLRGRTTGPAPASARGSRRAAASLLAPSPAWRAAAKPSAMLALRSSTMARCAPVPVRSIGSPCR